MKERQLQPNNLKRTLLHITLILVCACTYGQPLSLKEAIELGLQNNFQIEISKERVNAATMNNTWGGAGLWPTLDFSLNNSNNLNNQDNPASFINGQFSSTSLRGALDLNWTIFNGFKVKVTKEKLADLQEQSEGNARLVLENTVQSIMLSYYRLRAEQDKLRILKQTLDLSSSKFSYYQDRLELGVNTTFEMNQFKSNLLSDSVNYLLQEQAVFNAQKNLNMVLATEGATFDLSDSLETRPVETSLQDLEKQMINDNTNLKNQFLNNTILKKDVKLQRSAMLPIVSFGAGANRTDNWFEFDGEKRSGNALNYYANFTLNYRLFNGGNVKRAVKNAEIQLAIDEITTKEMEFNLSQDLKTFYNLLQTQNKIVKTNRSNEQISSENLKIAEQKLNQGTINSFDFRDTQTNQLRTSITSIESSFQYIQTYLELMKITGGILSE
ncbi:MAG: TolC family protein [Flavobacteriales bacterium]|nr:TolC family protein [Flavobacteriales bacterium]